MSSPSPLPPVTIPLPARFGPGATVNVVPRWVGAALCVHAPIRDGVPTPTRGVWVIASRAYGYAAGTYRGSLDAAVKLARLWDAEFKRALDAAPRVGAGVPSLSQWNQARAWSRQVSGDAAPTGPVGADHPDYNDGSDPRGDNGRVIGRAPEPATAVDGDGGDQFPATVTLTRGSEPGTVRMARVLPNGRARLTDPTTGRGIRMAGDVAAFKGPDPLTPVLRLWFDGRWFDVPSIAQMMEWALDSVVESPDGSRVEPDAPESWLSLLGLV